MTTTTTTMATTMMTMGLKAYMPTEPKKCGPIYGILCGFDGRTMF